MKRTILLAGLLVGCAVRPSADVRVPAMVRVGERLAMAGTEVTRGDFARFAAATGRMPDGPCGFLADGPSNRWVADLDHSWQSPGFAQTDRHPVVCVDFADANAYAAWLNKRTGRRFRLPTATEWERAARAGTKGERWWGADLPCAYANVADGARARLDLAGVIDRVRLRGRSRPDRAGRLLWRQSVGAARHAGQCLGMDARLRRARGCDGRLRVADRSRRFVDQLAEISERGGAASRFARRAHYRPGFQAGGGPAAALIAAQARPRQFGSRFSRKAR